MEYDPTPEDLKNLREWIEAVPYLPHDLGDHEFATYFRCFKGSLEKTKIFIDKFYLGRCKYPEILTNFNPLSDGAMIDHELSYKVPLPKRGKDGSLIVAFKMKDCEVDFNPADVFKMYALMFRILVLEDQLKSGKVAFIADCQNLKFFHIKKTTPQLIATVMGVITTIFPYRISGMHAIGLPQAAEWMVTLVKSLVKPKLAERIFLHKSADELLEWFPKEILPSDFGGDEESLDSLHAKYKAKLESYTERLLKEEEELKKLDVMRPQDNQTDIIVGSFKKLEID